MSAPAVAAVLVRVPAPLTLIALQTSSVSAEKSSRPSQVAAMMALASRVSFSRRRQWMDIPVGSCPTCLSTCLSSSVMSRSCVLSNFVYFSKISYREELLFRCLAHREADRTADPGTHNQKDEQTNPSTDGEAYTITHTSPDKEAYNV